MNHLLSLASLNNRYFVMRHGHSLANQQGLIVSAPENGVPAYGLSSLGRQQVEDSIDNAAGFAGDLRILSSDFCRARETAQRVANRFGVEIETDHRLRERFFGELELGPDSAYPEVWREDERDADHRYRQVESPASVMARVTALIVEIDAQYSGRDFLLVSHGDALQILLTAFAKRDVTTHRSLRHLETAEIRPLVLG